MPSAAAVFHAVEPQNPATQVHETICESVPGETANEIAELHAKVAGLEAQLARTEREAYERGRQEGLRQAQAELAPVVQRLHGAIAETVELRSSLRKSTERDLVQLALGIARRVLHRELQVDSEALGALARFAFDRMGRGESYHIRVHPRFASGIEQSLPKRSDAKIHVEADESCQPGALFIRTGEGAIDASIDTQLEEISRGLVDRVK